MFPGVASQINYKLGPTFREIEFKIEESREDGSFKARSMVNSKSRSLEDNILPTRVSSANPVAEACCVKRMKLGVQDLGCQILVPWTVTSGKTLTLGPSYNLRVTALALLYGLTCAPKFLC